MRFVIGAAEGGDMPLLPMPGMGQLPMPPLAGQTWDRQVTHLLFGEKPYFASLPIKE